MRDKPPRVATFWRYVRIQLMVFVFGIVAPIFGVFDVQHAAREIA